MDAYAKLRVCRHIRNAVRQYEMFLSISSRRLNREEIVKALADARALLAELGEAE